MKNCVIDTVTANGGASSGISTTNPCVVQDCTVSKVINTTTPALAAGLRLSTGSLASGNHLVGCYYGISGGKYQNNLTSGCTAAFSGGTDAGGNN